MTRAPFPAYRGPEPYAFVCYSHDDSAIVYPEMVWLREHGLELWYDDGIAPGSEWSESIASAIERCAGFIYFVTPRSIATEHCRRELSYAIERHREIVAVHLEASDLTGGLRLSLGNRQAVIKHQLSDGQYRRVLAESIARFGASSTRPSEPVERSAALDHDRIHILVSSPSIAGGRAATKLASGVARYVSWQGGIYQAHAHGSSDLNETIDYQIDLLVHDEDKGSEVWWQVDRIDTGELIWAGSAVQSERESPKERGRIAETIGEGAIRRITDHELQRISGRPIASLDYGRLLLKAEQPNYLDRARIAERLEVLKRAIELRPQAGFAYASLASLLSWQLLNGVSDDAARDESKARDAARFALKYEPNDPFVLLSAGTTYCRLGQYEQGLSLIRRSRDMAPTVRAKDQLAVCLCFAGRPEDAVPLFEDILETMPAGHTFPYVRYAVALLLVNRIEDALRFSREGIIHFSEDYFSWLIHANTLAQSGEHEEAQRAWNEARQLVPNLCLDRSINSLEKLYGRTAEQRRRITSGLRDLAQRITRA